MSKAIEKMKLAVSNIIYLFETANKADKLLMPFMLAGVIMECAGIFINTIMPKYIIDGLTNHSPMSYVLTAVLIMAGLKLSAVVLNTILENTVRYKKERLIQQYYRQFSDKTMSLDLQDVEDPDVLDRKEKAQRIITWNSMNIDGIKNALGGILSFGIQIAGFAYIIATLNISIILSVIAVMVLNAVINNYRNNHEKSMQDELAPVNRMWSYLSRTVTDYSFGKVIRVDHLCPWLTDKCAANREDYLNRRNALSSLSFRTGLLSNVVSLIQESLVYVFLVIALIEGTITYGDFYMYVAAVTAFTHAMKSIVSYIQGLNYTGRYVKDYREFLNIEEKLDNKDGMLASHTDDFEIRFENVSFCYPSSKQMVLENINVIINSKSKLSIVGDNGAGKTTFVKLLLRLYDPSEGNIYFNNVNIRDLKTTEYRSLFSVVFQDYQMFPFTIAENITFKDSLTPKEHNKLYVALENVDMSGKVSALANKENTYIGKEFDSSGTDFSGGEIQKLSLARSFFLERDINILDEPTANLSPVAEQQIYSSYSKLINSLAVFISHRMSSSKFCDRILVFDKGKLVEDGTHADLMRMDGLYARMYSLQASYYKE
jgi:ABC-type multidrug transport system fused ATPase/permease subunit